MRQILTEYRIAALSADAIRPPARLFWVRVGAANRGSDMLTRREAKRAKTHELTPERRREHGKNTGEGCTARSWERKTSSKGANLRTWRCWQDRRPRPARCSHSHKTPAMPRACYVILDATSKELKVEFVRVEFQIERATKAIDSGEMPQEYAQMLRADKG